MSAANTELRDALARRAEKHCGVLPPNEEEDYCIDCRLHRDAIAALPRAPLEDGLRDQIREIVIRSHQKFENGAFKLSLGDTVHLLCELMARAPEPTRAEAFSLAIGAVQSWRTGLLEFSREADKAVEVAKRGIVARILALQDGEYTLEELAAMDGEPVRLSPEGPRGKTVEQVIAENMGDPEFRDEWEKAVAEDPILATEGQASPAPTREAFATAFGATVVQSIADSLPCDETIEGQALLEGTPQEGLLVLPGYVIETHAAACLENALDAGEITIRATEGKGQLAAAVRDKCYCESDVGFRCLLCQAADCLDGLHALTLKVERMHAEADGAFERGLWSSGYAEACRDILGDLRSLGTEPPVSGAETGEREP